VQIKISARHGHLHDDTKQFIQEKAQKLLHFFERLTSIDITVDLESDLKTVEFVVNAEHKHDFVASEKNSDIRAATDLVVAKVEKQLRKYKERVQDHRRTPAMGDTPKSPSAPGSARGRGADAKHQTEEDEGD
jgi:putative sigma-54 modulation protein